MNVPEILQLVQLILLIVFGTGGFIMLSKIHVLVNSRLTTALDEISTLHGLLVSAGITPPKK